MPHRDPETGQFVGGDHSGAIAEADDILEMTASPSVGDTSVNTVSLDVANTPTTLQSFEFQKDYRVLAVEYRIQARTDNTDVTRNAPSQPDPITLDIQLATTASFKNAAAPGEGGERGAGVYFNERVKTSPPRVWDDDTNQNAGVIQATEPDVVGYLPAESLVDCDVTPDAGTDLSLHVDAVQDGGNADGMNFDITVRLYVQERE